MKTIALVSLLASGCFGTTKLDYSLASRQQAQKGLEMTVTTHNWLLGLVDGDAVVMGAACGQRGVATVRVEQGFIDWTIFVCSLGIYDRTTVVFTCE
jgi:hypothetical protein